ncbi:MAG: hypothetical protein PHW76_00085 [Alphaproteobacteria bacterium]|nr:hypothetical protein [Alphaproteobacteria bacterium]
MAGAIDTIGSSTGAQCGVGVALTAPPSERTPSTHSGGDQAIRNPKIIQDPMAGFITQYVNTSNGQVMDQSPSAVVVAYLKQGLTADGSPKNRSTQPPATV